MGISLKSEIQKDYYSRRIDRIRNSWIINLARKSARLFEAEGSIVAEAYKNGDWQKALEKNKKKWETFLVKSYSSILDQVGREHFGNLVKSKNPSKFKTKDDDIEDIPEDAFNPYDEVLQAYIVELAGTKVTMVTDWTRQVIGAIILDAKENNWTMDETARAIKNEFQDFSRYRAYRIARTETQNAVGFSQFEAGKQAQDFLGQTLIGEWWTSLDSRVRDSHAQLHGTRAKLGEAFGNGLLYAGEYTNTEGGANNINCRCVILHHFEDEDL
jgi:uncharacterized protein with gpF-like domain